jgi:cytochrome subunit of sulfide dehydrogenase
VGDKIGAAAVLPPHHSGKPSMTAARVSVAGFILLAGAVAASAAEAPPGASSCSGCHANAASVQTPVPPLKGRAANEIADAMTEYKSGKRPGTIMDRIAKGFSDEEIRAIATWYAEQK